jgi:adenylylsulfate kinase
VTRSRKGWCVWATGLPGSGKSKIANLLSKKLMARNIRSQLVSIDMLRHAVTQKPSYSEEESDIVDAALVFVTRLLTENGTNVIIDATGSRRRYRETTRKQIRKFIEVYLRCPLDLCIGREAQRTDTHLARKEIYKKGITGKSGTVPGINVPYEAPVHPELILDTNKLSPEESAERVVNIIMELYH